MILYGYRLILYIGGLGSPQCASAQVNLSLKCHVSLAMYLQDVWGGRPLQPPPARVDTHNAWRQRNPWYRGNLWL